MQPIATEQQRRSGIELSCLERSQSWSLAKAWREPNETESAQQWPPATTLHCFWLSSERGRERKKETPKPGKWQVNDEPAPGKDQGQALVCRVYLVLSSFGQQGRRKTGLLVPATLLPVKLAGPSVSVLAVERPTLKTDGEKRPRCLRLTAQGVGCLRSNRGDAARALDDVRTILLSRPDD